MSNNDQDLTSIKELASQLKASDALLKKIIKDFEIETIRDQKRVCLSDESVQTIRDILALRASGKKNNEIKELFYASKGIEAKPEEEVKEVTVKAAKPAKASAAVKDKEEAASEESEDEAPAKKILKSRKPRFVKDKKIKEDEVTNPDEETKVIEELVIEEVLERQQVEKPAKTHKKVEKEKDNSVLDLTQYLDEDGDDTSELKNLLNEDGDEDEDLSDLDDSEDIESSESVEQSDDKLSPRRIRRRQFSFRYIQRQIANDSKRVSYLKQKLKRGKLSVKEKMLIEDSLYHRSNLLNGWIHLLRWVKS